MPPPLCQRRQLKPRYFTATIFAIWILIFYNHPPFKFNLINMPFRRKPEETTEDVTQMFDAVALLKYSGAFDGLKDDLLVVLRTMNPEEQKRFFEAVLQPMVERTRGNIARLAANFASKPDGEKGKGKGKKRK